MDGSDDTNQQSTLAYYPGCTMKGQSHNFEQPTRRVFELLGYSLEELDRWSCCGGVFPLSLDNHMQLVSPTRNLAIAGNEAEELVTACAACLNVLKRTSHVLRHDGELKAKLNNYLADEVDAVQYERHVSVRHITEVLRDTVGLEKLSEAMIRPLDGLRVAPFYGCLLLRPADSVAIDDIEDPTILENLMDTTGAELVPFPYRTECCGAYLIASESEAVLRSSAAILSAASARGVEVLTVSCPLCHHNLEWAQKELYRRGAGGREIPILYITQLLGLGLGLSPRELRLDLNTVSVEPLIARFTNQTTKAASTLGEGAGA